MFVLMVGIRVPAQHRAEVLDVLTEDARTSVRDEPGCFRFDLLRDPEKATRFYLYEVYRDKAAFEAHLETPHFGKWKASVESMFDGEMQRIDMATVFPSDTGWEKQKPGLLDW